MEPGEEGRDEAYTAPRTHGALERLDRISLDQAAGNTFIEHEDRAQCDGGQRCRSTGWQQPCPGMLERLRTLYAAREQQETLRRGVEAVQDGSVLVVLWCCGMKCSCTSSGSCMSCTCVLRVLLNQPTWILSQQWDTQGRHREACKQRQLSGVHSGAVNGGMAGQAGGAGVAHMCWAPRSRALGRQYVATRANRRRDACGPDDMRRGNGVGRGPLDESQRRHAACVQRGRMTGVHLQRRVDERRQGRQRHACLVLLPFGTGTWPQQTTDAGRALNGRDGAIVLGSLPTTGVRA